MPSALADLGGWTNPDVSAWFADFTEVINARIGDRIASVATINEPWCVAYLSHLLEHHASGQRDIRAAARSMHHVLKAHGAAMTRLREMGQQNLGIVLNFDHISAAENTTAALHAATLQDATHNRWFIEAIIRGTYPAEAMEGFEPHMPKGWQDDLAEISQPLDWLGVNYYTRHLVKEDKNATWPAVLDVPGDLPKNSMGWEVYPQGIYDFLTRMQRDYVGNLPIYVTENGMPRDDSIENGAVHDPERQSFINGHIDAVHRAIADGANVQGFFYWSLLDNYEWAFGYEKRFGLVHVDFDTLKRTPKGSYYALKAALAR